MNFKITTGMLRALRWLSIVPFLFGCEQARVDALMEELCQKDGGMKIYEKVLLPENQIRKTGEPILFETWNRSSGGYKFTSSHEILKADKPTLTRYTYSVVRDDDKKMLGEFVTYLRIGGGLIWRPGPDPFKRCPTGTNDIEFVKKIFVKDR